MRFAAARQRVIAHNIANLDTPNFIARDVSVDGFRRVLDDAIGERRTRTGGMRGELRWGRSSEFERGEGGELRLSPETPGLGVLGHDRNNRDLVRQMQAMAESTQAFRVASELYKAHKRMLTKAIGERVG